MQVPQAPCLAERRPSGRAVLLALALVVAPSARAWSQASSPPDPGRETKLLPSDGSPGDLFGERVALSDTTAIASARGDDDNGLDAGSAYVFVAAGSSWSQQAKLLASDGAAGDELGYSVAISGDTAVVGAPGDDDTAPDSGSAYVFVRSGPTWTQQAKLVAVDGATGDHFGGAVAVSGDTVLVGAWGDDDNGEDSGSVYVFVRNGTVWSQQAKLLASDGAAFDEFGESVSLEDDTALLAACQDDDNGEDSGSVYVFSRSGSVWSEQLKLLASDGAAGDYFGYSVVVSGDRALIGAPDDDDKGLDSGSAYVFTASGGVWTEQAKLLASDGEAGDYFGGSVATSGEIGLVGTPGDQDAGPKSGSVYVYHHRGGTWTEQPKLVASDGLPDHYFGESVALEAGTAFVGAWGDDDNGMDAGAAYSYAPSLDLAFSGSCPGSVTVTISNGPPLSEVGVVAAANINGFTKGGLVCAGTVFEIGEPFSLPPLWIITDESGRGSGNMTLPSNRCWLEALATTGCRTSLAVQVP